LAVLLIAGLGGVLCAAVQSELAPPAAEAAKLDKGDLDPDWFDSTRTLEFHRTGPVDYLWVKPGLDLKGKLLHLDRWEAALADPDDEAKDRIKVRELTREMPQLCLEQWKEILKEDYACSLSDGVIRVVDASPMSMLPQACHSRGLVRLSISSLSTSRLATCS